jgi:hypothetical protein
MPVDTSWPIEPSMPPPGRAKVDPVFSSALEDAVEEAMHPDARKAKPAKKQAAKKQAPKKQAATKKAAPVKSAKAKKDARGKHGQQETDGKAEVTSPAGRARSKKKRASPPPAVNEPLAFINFVAAYNVGVTIEGEVVSFTSHGAMVDVSLPGGGVLHCYIPLTAMGDPPPTKARQVLKKGEVRPFVLAGLDPPRRVAELAIPRPEAPPRRRPGKQEPSAKKATPAKKAGGRPKKAPAKKAPAAKKQLVKKQPARTRAAAKKGGQPSRTAAPAKKRAAKTQPSKKQPANKQPAKKQPAKKQHAKKAAKARH